MNSHPEQSLLMRYIDGELAGRKARAIQHHLEACWECRTEVEEFQQTIADCVHYRKQVLAEELPAPPMEWRDIYREFEKIDAATPARSFFPWRFGNAGRWGLAAATAALAIAGVTYYKTHEAPSTLNGSTPAAVSNKIVSNKILEPPARSTESGPVTVEVPTRPAVPPSRSAAIVPGHPASISDELQVLSALHQIGADLGDPIQVSLSKDSVQVRGVGLTPARKQKILAALEPLPRIETHFSDPAALPLPADAGGTQPTVAAAPSRYQAKLDAHFGGRALLDRFTGQVLNWNETAMAHAYALRSLAQQFPAGVPVTGADQTALRALLGDHLAAMAAPASDFESELVPVLNSLGAASRPSETLQTTTWQAAAEHLFQASRRVEMLSSVLLGVTPGEGAHADLPSELLGAVNDLRADLDQSQRLLGR